MTVFLVVFGATMAALDLLLLALTPRILAASARMAPSLRADSILLARSAPVLAAFLLCACVLLPAWIRHEPADSGEKVSATLLGLTLLTLLPLLEGARRGARTFMKTRDRLLAWRRRGRNTGSVQAPFEVLEVKGEDLALCVGGYLKPTIYASTEVMESLEPEEFSAALAHEVSHASARDPLRLLWMGSCPDFLQLFRLDAPWRRAFSRACEFAADEGASRGDRVLALDLASALLKVARLKTFSPMSAEVLTDVAVSSAFSSPADIEARVKALADPPAETSPRANWSLRPWMLAVMMSALCGASVLASAQVHALTEAFGAFLAP
jgi:Zn-dependent protease with chaperone function